MITKTYKLKRLIIQKNKNNYAKCAPRTGNIVDFHPLMEPHSHSKIAHLFGGTLPFTFINTKWIHSPQICIKFTYPSIFYLTLHSYNIAIINSYIPNCVSFIYLKIVLYFVCLTGLCFLNINSKHCYPIYVYFCVVHQFPNL